MSQGGVVDQIDSLRITGFFLYSSVQEIFGSSLITAQLLPKSTSLLLPQEHKIHAASPDDWPFSAI